MAGLRDFSFQIGCYLALCAVAWYLTGVNFSELGVLLCAQLVVVFGWWLTKRPSLRMTHFYFFVCGALLMRETILIATGRIPGGVLDYSVSWNCAETKCVEWHKLPWLGVETTCGRHECIRHGDDAEKSDTVFVLQDRLDWKTLLATLCGWSAFLTSSWQLHKWRHQGEVDREVRIRAEFVGVILAVPPTYGMAGVRALRILRISDEDTWQAEGTLNAAELYSAVALFAFQRLLESWTRPLLGPDNVEDERSIRELRLWENFRKLINAGLSQYVLLVFVCNAIELLAKTWSELDTGFCEQSLRIATDVWFPHHEVHVKVKEGSTGNWDATRSNSAACEDLWNTISLWMIIANFFTNSIALEAIVCYERTFQSDLKQHSPFWKFWGVKGLLTVNFLQKLVLIILGFVSTSERLPSAQFRTFFNFLLVCIESAGLALMNGWGYAVRIPKTPETGGDVQMVSLVTRDRPQMQRLLMPPGDPLTGPALRGLDSEAGTFHGPAGMVFTSDPCGSSTASLMI